jgi:hypothetical protein
VWLRSLDLFSRQIALTRKRSRRNNKLLGLRNEAADLAASTDGRPGELLNKRSAKQFKNLINSSNV